MATNNSIIEGFQKLGFRISDETIGALIKDATKRRLSAVQLCERVIEAEMRERDTQNLKNRSRAATLGPKARALRCEAAATRAWAGRPMPLRTFLI